MKLRNGLLYTLTLACVLWLYGTPKPSPFVWLPMGEPGQVLVYDDDGKNPHWVHLIESETLTR